MHAVVMCGYGWTKSLVHHDILIKFATIRTRPQYKQTLHRRFVHIHMRFLDTKYTLTQERERLGFHLESSRYFSFKKSQYRRESKKTKVR